MRRDPVDAVDTDLDETVDVKVAEAVIDAYYPRAIAIAETARNRAQAAYAIVSALAGGTVAGILLTSPETRSLLTRAIGCLAIVAWTLAAALYLTAVAVPVNVDRPWNGDSAPRQPGPRSEFVQRVLERARAERDKVDQRQQRANLVAGLALMLTTATVVSAILFPPPEDERRATIVMNADGSTAIAALCHRQTTTLDGQLRVNSLKEEFVSLRVDPSTCGAGPMTVRIPRRYIVATRYDPA